MPFPRIATCIVCEGVRQEIGNKFTLLGYYGITPIEGRPIDIGIGNFDGPVNLMFVFVGGQGGGSFHVGMTITSESGQRFEAPSLNGVLDPAKGGTNVFMGFSGVLPGPGTFTASLVVDNGVVFSAPFRLERQQPAPTIGPPSPPPRLPPPPFRRN